MKRHVAMINWTRHATCFLIVVPITLVSTWLLEYLTEGAVASLTQDSVLVFGAVFFFVLDFVTAMIYNVWLRREVRFSSAGLQSGAVKAGVYIVLGMGCTIISNVHSYAPGEVSLFSYRVLLANVDLAAFSYMYLTDLVSAFENVTGHAFGDSRLGRTINVLLQRFISDERLRAAIENELELETDEHGRRQDINERSE